MAEVQYAPDGKHWQKVKKGNIMKMWNFFTQDAEIRKNLILNPFAKFRLIGDTGKTIGVLAFDKKKKEFVHLTDVV